MTTSATIRGGRSVTWTRDNIISALRRYADLYGEGFTSAAFSPSAAKWRDEPELIERYYAGDANGDPWPSLNAVKDHFGGSFNAARVAAGFEANKPGPHKQRRGAGLHKPIRDVSHVGATRTIYIEKAEEHTLRELDKLRAKVARLTDALDRARATKPKVKTKTKTKTKVVRVADEAALARARDRAAKAVERVEVKLAELRGELATARSQAKEARESTVRIAARLERAEATIHELRGERRELVDAARRADLAEDVARRELADINEQLAELRGKTKVIVKDAPEQAEIDAARASARVANERAAKAERDYFELAAAVKGEPRRLSGAEIAELRAKGPSGPAVLAKALEQLARARRSNNPTALHGALSAVMSAAATWRERL